MKEAALVIIKPDGISNKIVGNVFSKFENTDLQMVALKMAIPTKQLAEEHYRHISGTSFFKDTVAYFVGKFHNEKKLLAIIFYGENAIKKCRKIAGATNPEEADPRSIRGSYGRITSQGVYENVVHVSSDKAEAEREIRLWFRPEDIIVNLYPSKSQIIKNQKVRVWA